MLKKDKAHIRQLKTCKNLAAICLHDGDKGFSLSVINVETGVLIKTVDAITSAIFSEDGRLIIATGDGHDRNILVFDADTMLELSKITLSFPDLHKDVSIDKYRLFTIERLQDGNFIAMGAHYKDQDNFDQNIGHPIMFFLGNKLNEKTTLDDLKQRLNVKAVFWSQLEHQDDENIPMYTIDSVYNKDLQETTAFA